MIPKGTAVRYVHEFDDSQRTRLVRAVVALGVVLLFGTSGFTLIQDDWDIWKSLYFTVITITTVGYGDYGLTPLGERFTTLLLVLGMGTATYAFGQFVQVAVSYQMAWRRRMQKQIDQLRDHFVVCGVGRVGRAVCDRLTEQSMPFVLIETDSGSFDWARSRGYLAINGSATEDECLFQAGITRARGLVCAASSDSTNIVITLSARELNPGIQIISRASDDDSVQKFKRAGASQVVAPASNCGHDIASMLMRPHLAEFLTQAHHCESGYMLTEVTVSAGSDLVGQSVRGYGAKERSLVFVAMKRPDGTTRIRPEADDLFGPGDVVIVVGEPDPVARMSEQAKATPAGSTPRQLDSVMATT